MGYVATQTGKGKMKTGMGKAKKASAGTLKNVSINKMVPAPKAKRN